MNIATWMAVFGIDVPGVSLQWQFAFAGYSDFASGTQVCSDVVRTAPCGRLSVQDRSRIRMSTVAPEST